MAGKPTETEESKRMTANELRRRFPNAAKSFIDANAEPGLAMGGMVSAKPQQGAGATLDGDAKARKGGGRRVARRDLKPSHRLRVTLIAFRRRHLDDDNNVFKDLRDAVAASLGLDDDDPRIRFDTGEHVTQGREGTLVSVAMESI
jgi:hypothetical protein